MYEHIFKMFFTCFEKLSQKCEHFSYELYFCDFCDLGGFLVHQWSFRPNFATIPSKRQYFDDAVFDVEGVVTNMNVQLLSEDNYFGILFCYFSFFGNHNKQYKCTSFFNLFGTWQKTVAAPGMGMGSGIKGNWDQYLFHPRPNIWVLLYLISSGIDFSFFFVLTMNHKKSRHAFFSMASQ